MSDLFQLEIRRPGCAPVIHDIAPGVYPVGSENGNKLVIGDAGVEKRHAILIVRADGLWVEDLGARSGTWVNEVPVRGRVTVKPDQSVRMGDCVLIVRRPGAPARAAQPPPPTAPPPPPPLPPERPTPKPPPAPSAPVGSGVDRRVQEQMRDLKKQIHAELLNRLDIKRLTAAHIKEDDLHQRTQKTLEEIVNDVKARLPSWVKPEALIKEIYDESIGLGPLEDLLENPAITEIMVNRNDQIYVEMNGKLTLSDRMFMDDASVQAIIERIVAPIGRRVDESQPYVDARLKDGSRVNAIIPPLALNGPCLTIRKFSKTPLTVEDLIRFGSMTPDIAEFLRICVLLRKNSIIAGGTGSGKTTFLNVMSSFLPDTDRIVTIEDAAELRLGQAHVVRLESRPPNIEGRGAVTIRDLLRNALRMRPDRIVIGECRGGESLDMLQAMNTGHDGSMTTIHANTPRDVIARLETLTLMSGVELPSRAIREQIAAAVHLIVQTSRMSDGKRRVTHVTEVSGLEGDRITMQDLFVFEQSGLSPEGKIIGRYTATGSVPTFVEEIKTRGLSLDMKIFDPRHWTP